MTVVEEKVKICKIALIENSNMTLMKVAKKIGVSHTTVARVVNGSQGVSWETTEKVKKAIEEIGYTPKPKSLRQGPRSKSKIKSRNIAFVISGGSSIKSISSASLLLELVYGVQKSMDKKGLNLIQIGHLRNCEDIPPSISQGQLDGFIAWGPIDEESVIDCEVITPDNTVALMSGYSDYSAFTRICPDNYQIGRLAGQYLVKRGKKRLLFIDVDRQSRLWLLRRAGFRSFASDDVEVRVLAFEKSTLLEEPEFVLEKIADLGYEPDGIFFSYDQLTAIYQPLMISRGFPIGRGIDVVSCNCEESRLAVLSPRPASVDIQLELIGKAALEHLCWMLENPDSEEKRTIEIQPTLNIL